MISNHRCLDTKVDQVLPCLHLQSNHISKSIVNFRKNGSVSMKNKTVISALLKVRQTWTILKCFACASHISWTLCVSSQPLYISSIKLNIFVSQPYTVKFSHHLVFSFSRAKLTVRRENNWSRTVPKCISSVVQKMQCSMKRLGVVCGKSNSLLSLRWAFDICSL